jgi:sulfate adenylyltransferase
MTAADATAVASSCTLADGTPWPIQVILEVPADAIAADAVRLMLCDPEGTPLAVLDITERSPVQPPRGTVHAPDGMAQPPRDTMRPPHDTAQPPHDAGQPGTAGLVRLAGPVTGNRTPEHGPFRRLMIAPEQARALIGDGPVLAFATRAPLGSRRIGQLRHLASQLKARVLLLPLVAGPAEIVRQPDALIRAVLAAADSLPPGTLVVPVPLARRDGAGNSAGAGSGSWPDGRRELAATAIVAAAYGATHLVADDQPYNGPQDGSPQDGSPQNGGPQDPDYPGGRNERGGGTGPVPSLPGAPIPVLPAGDWAFDPRAEVWRPLSLIEAGAEVADLPGDELADLLDAGAPLPAWYAPEAVAAELRHARPPRSERGFVLFLTGLSGSGKSTIARDLRDLLTERGGRRVSLLDGDLVRALLSAGLTFSRADRDLNIARIGYVAAEIARHGGIAICAPIAPFAAARERVRQMVCEVGDFLLIYVATPVQVCEARDRKGLYAKARAGLIGQFTGISDPYEEPEDAALVIDTSVLSREQATEAVMSLLASGGWLPGG